MARCIARASARHGALAMALALALVVSACSPSLTFASAATTPLVAGDDSSQCETCLVLSHVVYDAVGDPYVEEKMSEYLIATICPNFDDKKSCEANVMNLVEALVAWMRANLEPEELCRQAGACTAAAASPGRARRRPAAAPLPPAAAALLRAALAAPPGNPNGPKDVTCPLCMFVLTKIKDALSDPITREKVHDAGLTACASLPGGDAATSIRDACVDFVERNEAEIYDYVDQTDPADLCAQLKACEPAPSPSLLAALAGGGLPGRRAAPFFVLAPPSAPSSPSSPSSPLAARLAPQLRALSDGNCDACLEVVRDVHRAIASPDLQDQATALAKQACAALPSGGGGSPGGGGGADLAGQCRASVDQYAPLVFGMALAYLQPATLCAQAHLCPPPTPPPSAFFAAAAAVGSPPRLPAPLAAGGAERLAEALRALVRGAELEAGQVALEVARLAGKYGGGDGAVGQEQDARVATS